MITFSWYLHLIFFEYVMAIKENLYFDELINILLITDIKLKKNELRINWR